MALPNGFCVLCCVCVYASAPTSAVSFHGLVRLLLLSQLSPKGRVVFPAAFLTPNLRGTVPRILFGSGTTVYMPKLAVYLFLMFNFQ